MNEKEINKATAEEDTSMKEIKMGKLKIMTMIANGTIKFKNETGGAGVTFPYVSQFSEPLPKDLDGIIEFFTNKMNKLPEKEQHDCNNPIVQDWSRLILFRSVIEDFKAFENTKKSVGSK